MNAKFQLTSEQVRRYHEFGYLVSDSGLDERALASLDDEIRNWLEFCRHHNSNFGETADGKAQFDLEAGHTREDPKLRRVANPADVSESYQAVLWDGPLVDMVAQLIGPNVRYHHSKLNIKLPKTNTHVHYHQDHLFDPHTNDDMLAILLMLDDTSEANGCLRVVPGSHRERYSHFRDGRFVGAIDASYNEQFDRRAVSIEARRGDVCFMHTWTVHGSRPNRTDGPRRLLISEYTASDAFPLLSPALPSRYTGRVVRGVLSPVARLRNDEIEMRTPYSNDSFFSLQGQPSAT